MPTPLTTTTSTAAPAVSLPNGNVGNASDGITPNQFALQPGESTDAYNTHIAGLRSAQGEPTYTGAPTDTLSAEDQVAQGLGFKSYNDAVSTLTAAPTQSESDLYNSAYSAAGLDTLSGTITSRQNDLATAQNKIDDNPWLDEADRVGRNKTVTDLANADINNYQNEYNTKLKSVEDLVTRESTDQTNTTTANKAKLAALESQAKALASQAATTAKNASAAPKTIKGANGATYKWNSSSGTFDQILPGKATGAATGKPTPDAISKITSAIQATVAQGQSKGQKDSYISPTDWSNALAEWTAAGYSTADFVKNFKGYANTKDPINSYEGL